MCQLLDHGTGDPPQRYGVVRLVALVVPPLSGTVGINLRRQGDFHTLIGRWRLHVEDHLLGLTRVEGNGGQHGLENLVTSYPIADEERHGETRRDPSGARIRHLDHRVDRAYRSLVDQPGVDLADRPVVHLLAACLLDA